MRIVTIFIPAFLFGDFSGGARTNGPYPATVSIGEDFLASSAGRKKMAAYLLKQGYDSALVESVVEETPVADD